MLQIPIQDTYNQTFSCTINNQYCKLNLYQKTFQGSNQLYCDLYINDSLILGGVVCQDRNRIVRDSYLGFVGDLMFVDQQGISDPISPGLNSRYLLLYIFPKEG